MRAPRSYRKPEQIDAFDRDILAFDLFAGDRDSGVTVFRNKMVATRKVHSCVVCLDTIGTPSRCRAQTEFSREAKAVRTFYVCPDCCEAVRLAVVDPDDAGRAIEARTSIGIQRSRERH